MALPGTSQDPDCRPTVRVIIDGTEVPVVNGKEGDTPALETTIAKHGTSDLVKVTEVQIPYEWGGEDVFSTITDSTSSDGLRSFGNDPVRIDLQCDITNQYVTIHHGPVFSAGPSPLRGAFRLLVTDWANIFSDVSINAEFTYEHSVQNVFETVADQLQSHGGLPQFDVKATNGGWSVPAGLGVVQAGMAQDQQQTVPEDTAFDNTPFDNTVVEQGLAEVQSEFASWGNVTESVEKAAPKAFYDYKHNCADVLDWICSKTQSSWWVEYNPETNTPTIVYDQHIEQPRLGTVGLGESGTIEDSRVLKNNAMFQISPQHTLGVRGEQSKEREVTSDEPTFPNNAIAVGTTIPEVVVEHAALAERAGSNDAPEFVKTDAPSLKVAEQEAKRRLKNRIDGTTGGEIVSMPTPLARPYGIIEAQPACNGRLDNDVPSVTYEIEEVVHKVTSPTVANDDHPKTLIRCGVECTMDDIRVKDKQKIEIK